MRNAGYLYLIQFANYILPLVTVPYLVRVLGPESYGKVAFGQSFIAYFTLLVDYGFNLSATRRTSVLRGNTLAVSRIASDVWAAKALLSLLSFGLLLALITLVSKLREVGLLLLILYGTVIGNILFPTWLFQGMERMVFISIINLLARLLVVVGVFSLIRVPEDYLLYAGLTSLGSIVAGVLAVFLAFRTFRLTFIVPSLRGIAQALAEGWALFLSQVSVSLYTTGNAFILGLLTNSTVVAYYSAAEKIVRAVVGLLGPISQAVYPRFAKIAHESKTLLVNRSRKLLFLMSGLGGVLTLILFLGAPVIVRLFLGCAFIESIPVMRALAPLPFLIGASNVLGIQLMLPCGMDREFATVLFAAGLINIGLAVILSPFLQHLGMGLAVTISELFVTTAMLLYLHTRELSPLYRSSLRN